jgi:hypothetical protein
MSITHQNYLGDKSDDSELSDMEGEEDDDSDGPVAVPLL